MHIRHTRVPGRLAALVVSGIAAGGMVTLATSAPALASQPMASVASLTAHTVSAPQFSGHQNGYPGQGGYPGGGGYGGGGYGGGGQEGGGYGGGHPGGGGHGHYRPRCHWYHHHWMCFRPW